MDWNLVGRVSLGLILAWGVQKLVRSWFRLSKIKANLVRVQNQKKDAFAQQLQKIGLPARPELTDRERKIIHLTASQVIRDIKSGELTVEETLRAISKQALRVHSYHNSISELNLVEAFESARSYDQQKKEVHVQKDKPLFGLPISVKDCAGIKGLDMTLGTVTHANAPSQQDSVVVHVLRKAGAIPFLKTNVPQTMLSFECKNPVFGRTTNPWNVDYTAGGSSGGESCLISSKGSFAGIGTDIGGSIRIPAHFSGCVGFKPTARRISRVGFRSGVPGQDVVPGVCGPMGSTVDDVVSLLRVLLSEEAWKLDSDLVPLPLDEKELTSDRPLRIGYYTNDGFVAATPACARAVDLAVQALRDSGYTVVPFNPPNVMEAVSIFYATVGSDAGKTVSRQVKDDVMESYVSGSITKVNLPTPVKALMAFMLEKGMGDERAATIVRRFTPCGVDGLWSLIVERNAYRQKFYNAWREAGIDVVLCPAHILPATPHDTFSNITFACTYTMLFNVLDYPAGVVPVTVVSPSDIFKGPSKLLETEIRRCYDPIRQAGLPLGVQVAAPPFQDATVLRVMKTITDLIPFTHVPPTPALNEQAASK